LTYRIWRSISPGLGPFPHCRRRKERVQETWRSRPGSASKRTGEWNGKGEADRASPFFCFSGLLFAYRSASVQLKAKAIEGLRPSFSSHVPRISCRGWWRCRTPCGFP
jgi:hypothetical protein